MTAREFSNHLHNLSQQFFHRDIPELTCAPRIDRTPVSHVDPLYDLITNYDTSTFESRGIDFHHQPRTHVNRPEVATYHGDALVFDPQSGHLLLIERDTNHIMCPVAESAAQFLDALGITAEFAARCLTDDRLYDDQTVTRTYASRSAQAAGGDAYLPFYETLIGI